MAVIVLMSPRAFGAFRLVPVLLLPWLVPMSNRPDMGMAKVVVLDVGQGLSVLVRTHSHSFLYDTGHSVSLVFPWQSV